MTYLAAFDFTTLGLHPSDVRVLETLQEINLRAEQHLAFAMQVPEFDLKLDLESRVNDEARQFKHIHQMCLFHATHLQMANKIRTTYLLDSYLWAATRLNPLATFNAARAFLELHAMTRYVQDQLKIAAEGPSADWRARGLRYFRMIIRARFGTAAPATQALMKKEQVSPELLERISLRKTRAFLANEIEWIENHYAALCDFVHPNASSQRTTAQYIGDDDIAVSSTGGAFVLSGAAPIIEYRFPMPVPGRAAVRLTAQRALTNVEGIIAATNDLPQTPYTKEELLSRTGSPIGLASLDTQTRPLSAAAGRNDPCPCGSGRKFKKCHGVPQPS